MLKDILRGVVNICFEKKKKKKKKFKTINIKKATNSQLSTTESKKQTKQPEQEQNHGYVDHLEGYQLGDGRGRMGEKVQE